MEDIMSSQLPTQVKPMFNAVMHRLGIQKNIRITNNCHKSAYVIVAPALIKTISTIGIEKIGNIEFEISGDYKSEEMQLYPGDTKPFKLDTTDVYISILIEVEDRVWKEWRYNRRVDTTLNDYNIPADAPDKCSDRSFLDYTRK